MTFRIPVGADAHIGPLHQLPLTSRPAAAKREAETMRQPPRQVRHHPPRDGSCKFAETHSVPEGQAKSEQAPIRRPPSRGGPLHRSAPKRLFLFHRARRILFLAQPKREWGAHPPRKRPPGGSQSPPAAGRRPAFLRAVDNRPHGSAGGLYHRADEGIGPYGCPIHSRLSLRPTR